MKVLSLLICQNNYEAHSFERMTAKLSLDGWKL